MARDLSYAGASVVDLVPLTRGMRRLTLRVDATAAWSPPGVADEAVLLVFPDADGRVGLPDERDDADPYEKSRWYTIRGYDEATGQVTLDLVTHGVGESTRWARRVRPGDPIGISSASSWYERPADAGWQLLVGDLPALPAISRVIESHTDGSPLHAYVVLHDRADEQHLELPAGAALTWVHERTGSLADTFAAIDLPDGPGYVFVAGEAAATRAARRLLRHERGLSRERYCVTGYWRVRSQEWRAQYAAAQERLGLPALYERMDADGADTEALADEIDRRLAAAGL